MPLSIDYFPTQQEVAVKYTFAEGVFSLRDFKNAKYESHAALFEEMVRQRITQDYQLAPPSHVDTGVYTRMVKLIDYDNPRLIRKFLTMGHRIQIITLDPSTTNPHVHVLRLDEKDADNESSDDTFKYFYQGWNPETKQFVEMVQSFKKYSEKYYWSMLDSILAGDSERDLRDGMRFRRVMFGIVPDEFTNEASEKEYVAKFQRLVEYFLKLRGAPKDAEGFGIRIVTSQTKTVEPATTHSESVPGIERNSMKRFNVHFKKTPKDAVEWLEMSIDSTFDTSWSYRIVINWFVARSSKVDTQIQLLQRRCTQYGLNLVPFPQLSVSENLLLNPFRPPTIFPIRDKTRVSKLDDLLIGQDFVFDGVFFTDGADLAECIDRGRDFDFGRRRPKGKQYVHRSSTIFVRVVEDKKSWALVVVYQNAVHLRRKPNMHVEAEKALEDLSLAIARLSDKSDHSPSSKAPSSLSTADRKASDSTSEKADAKPDTEPLLRDERSVAEDDTRKFSALSVEMASLHSSGLDQASTKEES